MKSVLTLLIAALLIPTLSSADTITGRLIDSNGVGIANGDVDAFDIIDDDDIVLTGDSTDANGFFSITIPAGLYLFTFQGPPGSTLIDVVMDNVAVSGTLAFGDITLEEANVLSGRVLDINGFPVASCDLDIFDGVSGVELSVSGARTDIFGNFTILVPADILVHFDPRNVIGATLAPQALTLALTGDTNLGDITLQPGLLVSGVVSNSLAAPLQGARLTFLDPDGNEALTYGDTTNASGSYAVVVAANTWDIEICPPSGIPLAPTELTGIVVAGATNLGNTSLQVGISLFGTVTDSLGFPVQGVDVDVNDSATGSKVALCGDGTNAAGFYSIFVPAGTHDVLFTAPNGLGIHTDVVTVSATQVDCVLTPCAPASATVRNGSGVNPLALISLNPPRIAKTWNVALDCTGFAPSFGVVVLNNGGHPGILISIGEYLLSGQGIFVLAKAHVGNVISFSTPLPTNVALCGRLGFAQGLILGSPGPQLTNALDLMVGH